MTRHYSNVINENKLSWIAALKERNSCQVMMMYVMTPKKEEIELVVAC